MSTLSDEERTDKGVAEGLWTAADDAELRALDERLAELREQGIISGGEGPRASLRPVAHIPGALKRFLEQRG